jgi:tetratricopeptide (TPR) repeat protein
VLAAGGDRAAAIDELRAVLAQEPGSFTASFNLGVLLLDDGDAAGALGPLGDAVRGRPGDAEARRSLGEALLALDRVEEALPHLRAAVEADPADEAGRVDEAVALLRLSRLADARLRLEEAVRDLPAAGRPAHLLARLLASSTDLALRDGERALELASAVWAARPALEHGRTLAMALAEVGRCEEAARLAERLAVEAPAPYDTALQADAARYAAGPPCRPSIGGE